MDPSMLIVRLCRRPCLPAGDPLLPGPRRDVVAAEELGEGRILDGLADFDVVVIDARGDGDGGEDRLREAIRRTCTSDAAPPAVAVIEDAAAGLGPAAVGAGAWDVLLASEVADQLADRLRAASRVSRLRRAASRASASDPDASSSDPGSPITHEEEPLEMVGTSDAIRAVFGLIRRVAPFDVPVLLTGESGTGKELAARAHPRTQPAAGAAVRRRSTAARSRRHCSRAELFGHERGAFTGADARPQGTLRGGRRAAPSSSTRSASCRRRYRSSCCASCRSTRSSASAVAPRVPVDVRVIAATNRDLAGHGRAQGTFREDLYFRLTVLTDRLPPLRERGDDVAAAGAHFLQRYSQEASSRCAARARGDRRPGQPRLARQRPRAHQPRAPRRGGRRGGADPAGRPRS